MEAPPSPDYIPGPEAPPSPDYVPGPEAPPSPDYILGPEYPEYLPPADDVLPAKEQPLPAAVSPTAKSPGYITDLKPEMEPEEEDGDDEKSEEDSIEYPTSGGDDDADDDGDDLSDDDDDDEDEEESSDSETAATPPLSSVSPTLYPLPPLLMPLPIFTPLPTLSFPLPSSLPSTFGSESIPEADIPLRKARFTTPTSGYEVGESFVAAAARQIRPALTIADRRRANDRLIGRLRRERRYFRTLFTTYAQEALIDQGVAAAMAEAEASRVRNGYGSNGSGPRLAQAVLVQKIESVFNINNCTAACQVKYAACTLQGVALTWWNSHVKTVTVEVAQALPWKTLKKMMTDKYCPRGKIKKLKTEMWELKTKGTDVIGYNRRFQELALMCDRTFAEESDRVEKYIGGVPNTIHDSVKAAKPKTM
nr:reverse transcriptase domain-containing protein [Tanacetum cinerariifolium]